MVRRLGSTAAVVAVLGLGGLAAATPARAQTPNVRVGVLTCNVASGFGMVFGSSRALNCLYSGAGGRIERYYGTITKFGVDIGYTRAGVIVWGVVAPSANLAPGALAGTYAGGTASATIGVGVGANALFGGSNRSIALQPVSISDSQGLNVAAGIASITLRYHPYYPPRYRR